MTLRVCALIIAGTLGAVSLSAQLGTTAGRVLGQPDLRQNSLNSTEGVELLGPSGVAFDERGGQLRIYVVDRENRRVLAWQDVEDLESGAVADLVLGQFDVVSTGAFGIGPGGFSSPNGIVVDPETGDVYVSDGGAHRITRFRNPFSPNAVLEPDHVYGQSTFFEVGANPGGVTALGLRNPTGLALDEDGNLWVADTGNNRVLRFAAESLNEDGSMADLVLGQLEFGDSVANVGGSVSQFGLRAPEALAFDAMGTLYVADTFNSRVLAFQAPFMTAQGAIRVLGQLDVNTAQTSGGAQPWSLRRLTGLAIGPSGALVTVMPDDHRALIFDVPELAVLRTNADDVIGQANTSQRLPNSGSLPAASATGLLGPSAVAIAPDGTIAIADTGNHRVTIYPKNSAEATLVLGQGDLAGNSPNRVGPAGIGASLGIAVDYSREGFPIYASDLLNHRVLAWSTSLRFANVAPADLVIGQIGFEAALPNAGADTPSALTLDGPRGIAVSGDGDLYVADSGNNRVLRFQKPFDQTGQPRANLVLGQSAFFTRSAAFINGGSMNNPTDVEISSDGRIYVSDTGNHRVMEFAAGTTIGVGAVRVFGQAAFNTGVASDVPAASNLNSPLGIGVEGAAILYVADSGNNRVLLFPLGPETPSTGAIATNVIGQAGFDVSLQGNGPGALRAPADVAVGAGGRFYVADADNHRVLEFIGGLFLPSAGSEAVRVVGQPNLNSRAINYNSVDGRATAQGLFQPSSIFLDRNGMLYVGDAGNNRIVEFLKPAVAVSAATFLPGVGVSAGTLASVFGVDLTGETAAASAVPLPTELGGSFIEMSDGVRLPLIFASPGQVNVQIPPATPVGGQALWVRRAETDELIGAGGVNIASTRPGLFTFSQDGLGAAVAVNEDGSFNSPENPAPRGSVVTFYGTGQGPTEPTVAAGEAPPGGVLANTVAKPTTTAVDCLKPNSMCVLVGSKIAETLFSGLAPNFVGLWQLNVRIPPGEDVLTGASIPVKVLVNQIPTNDNVFISIQ